MVMRKFLISSFFPISTSRRFVHSNTKKLLHNQRVAIVGGGPGGLTLARLLQMNGANVKVYEKQAHRDARPQGASVDLEKNSGLLALETAGLLNEVKQNMRSGAEKLRVLDGQGNVLMDEHTQTDEEQGTAGDEPERLEIDHIPLQNVLLDSLKPETVRWNSQVKGLVQDGNGWKIEFENGSSDSTDLVIGADGGNSKIRSFVTSITPKYSGITMVEGVVNDYEEATPNMSAILQGGKLCILGNELSLIVSSRADKSLVFWTGMKCDEKWATENGINFSDAQQVFSWFKKTFSGWTEAWDELFTKSQLPFRPIPLYHMPVDQTWESKSNVTLIGDAAHLMPPYSGEGVNLAMHDALDLFQSLQKYEDALEAIVNYEQKMLTRANECAQQTLESTEALHSPEGADIFLGTTEEGGHEEDHNLEQQIEQAHDAVQRNERQMK